MERRAVILPPLVRTVFDTAGLECPSMARGGVMGGELGKGDQFLTHVKGDSAGKDTGGVYDPHHFHRISTNCCRWIGLAT